MEKGFRESMRWLHTWSGLIVGWLLFAIFVTGTSSYYKNEITLWMKPEFHKSMTTNKTIEIAIDKAIENSKKATKVNISLPNSRTNLISIRTEGVTNSNSNMQKKNQNNKTQKNERQNRENPNFNMKKSASDNKGQSNAQENKQKNKNQGKRRRVPPTYFDASTGELVKEVTKTGGGNFLYRFHFELYSIPRDIARWIIGIATMSMLVAIISGIIIHKRIFKDIFTFRPKNNPRGWMDAHILPAVAALPFFIMITYSGLLLFTNTLMPWAIEAHFDDFRSYKNAMRSGNSEIKQTDNKKQISIDNPKVIVDNKRNANAQRGNRDTKQVNSKTERNANSQRGNRNTKQTNKNSQNIKSVEKTINNNVQRIMNNNLQKMLGKYPHSKNLHRIASSNAKRQIIAYKKSNLVEVEPKEKELIFSKSKLVSILEQSSKIWPENIGGFSIEKDTKNKTIKVVVSIKEASSLFNTRQRKSLVFDAKTAKLIEKTTPKTSDSIILNTSGAFRTLHEAKFADSTIRFLFFICGLSGIIISGTGLILWIEKRKKKNSEKKTKGFWLVEKLNIGTMMGLFIAIAVYFIINRVIPSDVASRENIEINAFFIAWLISYLHAFIRNTSKAWIEQLRFAAKLFIFIPILNAILVFDSFSQIFDRDMIFIYFDLFFIFMAVVFNFISSILIRKSKRKVIT